MFHFNVKKKIDGSYVTNVDCSTINVSTFQLESSSFKKILRITDILGRESNETNNVLLFYTYDDGTVEKKIVLE